MCSLSTAAAAALRARRPSRASSTLRARHPCVCPPSGAEAGGEGSGRGGRGCGGERRLRGAPATRRGESCSTPAAHPRDQQAARPRDAGARLGQRLAAAGVPRPCEAARACNWASCKGSVRLTKLSPASSLGKLLPSLPPASPAPRPRRAWSPSSMTARAPALHQYVVCFLAQAHDSGFHDGGSSPLLARSQKYGKVDGGSPPLLAMCQKYGKLERGQLLKVPAYLVKRQKQHCHHLEQYDVDLILGFNGFIWVGFTLTAELIIETAQASSSSNIGVNDMLGAEFCVQTAQREAKRQADLVR
ncbi:hypothetical protein ACP4OV_025443 [Aristida adscensionis]